MCRDPRSLDKDVNGEEMQQEKSREGRRHPWGWPTEVSQLSFSLISFAQDLEHLSAGGRGRAINQVENGENICTTGKKMQKGAPWALPGQIEEHKGSSARSELTPGSTRDQGKICKQLGFAPPLF